MGQYETRKSWWETLIQQQKNVNRAKPPPYPTSEMRLLSCRIEPPSGSQHPSRSGLHASRSQSRNSEAQLVAARRPNACILPRIRVAGVEVFPVPGKKINDS